MYAFVYDRYSKKNILLLVDRIDFSVLNSSSVYGQVDLYTLNYGVFVVDVPTKGHMNIITKGISSGFLNYTDYYGNFVDSPKKGEG